MSNKRYRLIYPEYREVTGKTIRGWFQDALADGRIPDEYKDANNEYAMALALQDIGFITLGSRTIGN